MMYVCIYICVLLQRVVRVKKMDEGEEEGAELSTEEIEELCQRMYTQYHGFLPCTKPHP